MVLLSLHYQISALLPFYFNFFKNSFRMSSIYNILQNSQPFLPLTYFHQHSSLANSCTHLFLILKVHLVLSTCAWVQTPLLEHAQLLRRCIFEDNQLSLFQHPWIFQQLLSNCWDIVFIFHFYGEIFFSFTAFIFPSSCVVISITPLPLLRLTQ